VARVNGMSRLNILVWLKFKLWWNGLRSGAMAMDTAVAVLLTFLGGALSLALALGLGVVTHLVLREVESDIHAMGLLVVFWILGFLAVVLPLFFGMGQSAVPVGRLAVFPVSRGGLYRISLAASFASSVHVFWYPILLSVSLTAMIIDRTPVVLWVVVVTTFSVSLVVWCNTLLLVMQRILSGRNTREVVVLVGLVLLVTASMVPALLDSQGLLESQNVEPVMSWFQLPEPVVTIGGRVVSMFPPSIASTALIAGLGGEYAGVLQGLMWLALWIAAGMTLGYLVLRKRLVDGDSSSPGRSKGSGKLTHRVAVRLTVDSLSWIPVESRAVAAKELHYLLRSTVGKFNIVIMPVFVMVMAMVIARDLTGPVLGLDPSSLVFVGAMVYASMFSNNPLYNAYAWDGTGVRSYFINPIAPDRVILGKNVGVWLYNVILAFECAVSYSIVAGVPSPAILVGGFIAFAAALLSSTVAGNFVSPAVPVARDISKITNSPSQTGVLASFGMLLVNVVLIGGLLAISALLGAAWLVPVLLGLLLIVEITAYPVFLRPAARLLEQRREALVEAVQIAG
jgi:hypothetical protein